MRPYLTLFFALATALPAAAQSEEPETLLSPREIESLNKKVREWMGAEIDYDNATGRARERAARTRSREREKFSKEWNDKMEKNDLLGSMPDLIGIFRDAFPYESFSKLKGQITSMGGGGRGDEPEWDIYVPKTYDAETPYRVVVLLAGRSQEREGEWADGRNYFEATWEDAEILKDTIVLVPKLDPDLDLDTTPDFSRPEETENDRRRREALFMPAGLAQRELHFDRDRLILDCGKGTSRFGLRMATYFPSRFAGLILRHPEDIGLRYESLCGTEVLLIANDETREFCGRLHGMLEQLAPGTCTVLDAKGEYPYGDLKAEIGEWTAKVDRNLFRDRVVIAPNHDLYHRSYWIQIGTAEPLASVAPEDRPFLEAKVDREANKIEVVTKSVTDFVMYLNDAIVDLDKEVTVVVNGVANKQKRSREFALLRKLIYDFYDPNMIFTVQWGMTVPDSN